MRYRSPHGESVQLQPTYAALARHLKVRRSQLTVRNGRVWVGGRQVGVVEGPLIRFLLGRTICQRCSTYRYSALALFGWAPARTGTLTLLVRCESCSYLTKEATDRMIVNAVIASAPARDRNPSN